MGSYLVGVTALFLAAVDSAGVEAGVALAAHLVRRDEGGEKSVKREIRQES